MRSSSTAGARLTALALLAVLLWAPESGAQVVIRKGQTADSTVRMERFDATRVVLLPELGAVITVEGKDLVVSRVMPAERRPEAYRSVDLQAGDRVLLLNGKRVRGIPPLRESYDALGTGAAASPLSMPP